MNMKRIVVILLVILLGVSCSPSLPKGAVEGPPIKRPKNIILLIGDGMGLTQISAGMYSNGNRLNLERFPVTGLHKSYSSNSLITDSAAGATAFACGIKTYNGAIGVNTDTVAVKNIVEWAEERGKATGLVATSSITHATPAAFIAHVASRDMHEEIAEYFLKTDIDFFIGGGKKYFDQREKDDRNLGNELVEKDFFLSDYLKTPLHDIPIVFDKKFAYFTADAEPETYDEGRRYLLDAGKLAPVFLKNYTDKGFFLMIESSQIDWGGHANDSDYIVSEMIEFDRVIGEVLDFAVEDGETLVIVTADHETGGYSIDQNSTWEKLSTSFTTDKHTAVMIPVFAYGPQSDLFNGMYENTAIYGRMLSAWGINVLDRK